MKVMAKDKKVNIAVSQIRVSSVARVFSLG